MLVLSTMLLPTLTSRLWGATTVYAVSFAASCWCRPYVGDSQTLALPFGRALHLGFQVEDLVDIQSKGGALIIAVTACLRQSHLIGESVANIVVAPVILLNLFLFLYSQKWCVGALL